MTDPLLDIFDLDDEIREIIGTKPEAMPMVEFLSFFIELGAYQYRDARQQDKLEWRVRRGNRRIVECSQQGAGMILQDNLAPASASDFAPRLKGL